jgi:Ca-activated chloride channel homolog
VAALVNETIERGRKGQFVEKNTVRLVERFQWPLALGLWCLIVSFCYEFPVRPRPRDVKLSPHVGNRMPQPQKRSETGARILEVGRVGGLLLCLVGLLGSGLTHRSFAAEPRGSDFAAFPVPVFAAATLATPSASAPTPPAAPPEGSALAKIVGRLAVSEQKSARDWAELGRETANWGSRLQTEKQTVPEGPVRDALAAVDIGSKIDRNVTDWTKLREELENLLKKPEEEQQQPQDQQDKNEQQQQNENQKKQDQKSDPQKQDKSGQPQSSQDKKDSSQKEDPSQKQDAKPPEQKPEGESAFGDMNKKQEPPPPPPQQNTQKVGGAPEKKEQAQEPTDPSLALPMQKLEQLKNQDSPAQLFQLMEGDKKPTKKSGKDW